MKLRFIGMTIENGLTWKRLNFPLEHQGLVLIRGDNGAGKSGIRELLGAPLYGKTEKSGSGNELVNRKIDKEMRILIELDREEDDGWVKYNVMCTRKCSEEPTGVRIWRGEDEEPITPIKNPVAAQKMAADLMGMSFAEFQAVVSIGQESIHPLIEGTDGSRSDYVSKTFDLEYGHYLDAASKRLKTVNVALEGISNKKGERAGWAAQEMDALSLAFSGSETKRMDAELRTLDRRIKTLNKDIRGLDRLMDGQRRREELENDTRDHRASDAIEKLMRKCDRDIKKFEDTITEWDEYDESKGALEKLKAKLPPKRPKFDPKRRTKLIRRRDKLDTQLRCNAKLKGHTACPTCGQDTAHIQIDVNSVRAEMMRLSNAIEKDRKNEGGAEVYDKIASSIKSFKLPVKPKMADQADMDQAIHHARTDLTALRAEYKSSLQAEAHRGELKKLPAGDWRESKAGRRKLQDELKEHTAAYKALMVKVSELEANANRQATVYAKIKALDAEISKSADLEREKHLLTGLVAAFGPRGLKREKVREILDIMARHLRQYTSAILPRYKFTLVDNEKKTAFVATDKESDTSGDVRTLSKGEKKRLSIALLLTERDMRRVRTNILFLDEFDGGLDRRSTEDLIELLSELKDEYESIFAISQSPIVHDYDGFDKQAVVSKPGTFSKIRWD